MNKQGLFIAAIAIVCIAAIGFASSGLNTLDTDPSDVIDTSMIPTANSPSPGDGTTEQQSGSIRGGNQVENVKQVMDQVSKQVIEQANPGQDDTGGEGEGDGVESWWERYLYLILGILAALVALGIAYLYIRRKYGGIMALLRSEEEKESLIGFQRVDMSNDVYRAWAEMVAEIELENPRSKTPDEFAIAAIEEGMKKDDVWELTEIFEEVLYGEEEVTKEHESAARRTIERIRARRKKKLKAPVQ